MKCLNEPIARRANAEDGCTGHFWEARFQSQALRSDRALLTAMAYVDLNPVRAGMTKTPEDSEYTSIAARTQGRDTRRAVGVAASHLRERKELSHRSIKAKRLVPFAQKGALSSSRECLPVYECDYLRLVDVAGRQIIDGKRGRIDPTLKPILERLGLSYDDWAQATSRFRMHYRNGDLTLGKNA